jgi:hypothetical protein
MWAVGYYRHRHRGRCATHPHRTLHLLTHESGRRRARDLDRSGAGDDAKRALAVAVMPAYGCGVSVVRRERIRRWAWVAGGVAVLCLVPASIAAWPAGSPSTIDAVRLHDKIMSSAGHPYQGYATTTGRLGLPLPGEVGEVVGLLGDELRLRAWYAGPTAWRVAELTVTGERDTYRTADGSYVWDFERSTLAYTQGELGIRPPRAADLVPPELARRLLAGVTPDDQITLLDTRRIAGVSAAGIRVAPADPATTVGRVDVWADPVTGLPVRVEVSGRNVDDPVLTSRFLDLRQTAPDAALLRPTAPSGLGYVSTTAADIQAELQWLLGSDALPGGLAGQARTSISPTAETFGVGTYGGGFTMFAVLPLPGRISRRTLNALREAGATPVPITGAEAYAISASILTAVMVRTDGDRASRRSWLLAGMVASDVLEAAARELVASP